MRMGAGYGLQPNQLPSEKYLLEYVTALSLVALLAIVTFKWRSDRDRHDFVHACGVSIKKMERSVGEIKRKGFHIAGLLVPLVQLLLLRQGWDNHECVKLCWTITIIGTGCDFLRLHSSFVAANWPLRSILREHEHKQLTGGCYFSLGCTLAICARRTHATAHALPLRLRVRASCHAARSGAHALLAVVCVCVCVSAAISPPSVAMASILFLVLGDMVAAIVGVSFGGDALGKLKLGREGKKSLEGSLAMFFVCFFVGSTVFAHVRLREYAIFFGALVATLTELHEPLGINDNLSIPLFSSLAMQLAFYRISAC